MNRFMRGGLWAFAVASFAILCQASGVPSGRVHISVGGVRVDYCSADPELALATIHVRVTFTNRGKRVLILSRQFGPDENLRLTTLSGVTVFSPNVTNYETSIPRFGSAPDKKMFELISPGASVQRDFVTGFHVSIDPSRRVDSTPLPGDYRIWVRRSTWPVYGDETGAREARERWARYGLLLIQKVKLQGVRVHISIPQRMTSCGAQ